MCDAYIKKKHERFHTNNFLEWINKTYHCNYRVISEPEPPEAIIQTNSKKSWVEISTAFLNSYYAQDVTSYATSGEKHVRASNGLFLDPDKTAAHNFITVVKKKLEKRSYLPIAKELGPGYLIIPILNPFFDEDTLSAMKDEWNRTEIEDLGCFRSIFVSYRSTIGITVQSNWKFYRWPKKRMYQGLQLHTSR